VPLYALVAFVLRMLLKDFNFDSGKQ